MDEGTGVTSLRRRATDAYRHLFKRHRARSAPLPADHDRGDAGGEAAAITCRAALTAFAEVHLATEEKRRLFVLLMEGELPIAAPKAPHDLVRLTGLKRSTLANLKTEFGRDEAFGAGHLFLEDAEEPLCEDYKHEGGTIFLHHNRCERVNVLVRYAGKVFDHDFTPGSTLKKIKRRAEKKLNIDAADAVELSLQLAGTTDRPDEATHVGSLVAPKTCAVVFDLVPTDRING